MSTAKRSEMQTEEILLHDDDNVYELDEAANRRFTAALHSEPAEPTDALRELMSKHDQAIKNPALRASLSD